MPYVEYDPGRSDGWCLAMLWGDGSYTVEPMPYEVARGYADGEVVRNARVGGRVVAVRAACAVAVWRTCLPARWRDDASELARRAEDLGVDVADMSEEGLSEAARELSGVDRMLSDWAVCLSMSAGGRPVFL